MDHANRPLRRRILVFAKAPIPGFVKTRLQPMLNANEAAEFHMALVLKTLTLVCHSRLAPVELWIDANHSFFQDCQRRYPIKLKQQQGLHIGERMQNAFKQSLSANEAALIIGTDCPVLTINHLRLAFNSLNDRKDIVLIPAVDGGYVLIGARRFDETLFHDIPWGTQHVMSQTRNVLKKLNWTWEELETLWDIDRPQDLQRLCLDPMLSKLLPFRRNRKPYNILP